LSALRILGVQKKVKGGVTLLRFASDPQQLDLCKADNYFARDYYGFES